MVSWNDVFSSQTNSVNLVEDFVTGRSGLRNVIEQFSSPKARRQLYALEKKGAKSARSAARNALRRIGAR